MYRRSGRGRVLLLVFLALSIVLITLDFRQNDGGALRRAKELSATALAPVQRGITVVVRPIGDFFSGIGNLASLRRENEEMSEEIRRLRQRQDAADYIISENVKLRDLQKLSESWVSMDSVSAEVIAKSPKNYEWAVEIDKGKIHGIRREMAVLAPDGLVGKVISVLPRQSTVQLLIDPGFGVGARLEGLGDTGVVTGDGPGSNLRMQFVDSEADVDVGDLVFTSGEAPRGRETIFPPGIPIGTVVEVGDDERALDKEIEVGPAVKFTSLHFVEILFTKGRFIKDAVAGGAGAAKGRK